MATDEFTWVLSEIRTEFRRLTGRSQTTDISDSDCNKFINDYYVNYFPEDALVVNFDGFFTQETAPSDDGEYSLAQTIVKLMEPMTIDGKEITFYQDKNQFFIDYPDDEQFITDPTLVIGSSDSTKVKNSAFKYDLNGTSYSKASAETAFSGLSTVPQNKYGAFSLKIDEDGTITIAEADGNSTGYDAPSLAIDALASADSDTAFMGFVTVISTDSGGFVPGTTALDDSAVTDTFTDGKPSNRDTPLAALVVQNKLYLRPRPGDIHLFKAASEMNRPDALSGDIVAPADVKWGPAIALGAAIRFLASRGGLERIQELTGITNFSIVEYTTSSIQKKKRLQMRGRVSEPNF